MYKTPQHTERVSKALKTPLTLYEFFHQLGECGSELNIHLLICERVTFWSVRDVQIMIDDQTQQLACFLVFGNAEDVPKPLSNYEIYVKLKPFVDELGDSPVKIFDVNYLLHGLKPIGLLDFKNEITLMPVISD